MYRFPLITEGKRHVAACLVNRFNLITDLMLSKNYDFQYSMFFRHFFPYNFENEVKRKSRIFDNFGKPLSHRKRYIFST